MMAIDLDAAETAHARNVKTMFAGIAGRYDLLNHVLSFNIDKGWRRRVRNILADVLTRKEATVLDVACGTGDLTIELQRNAAATVIGTDFCRPMLEIAYQKNGPNRLHVPYIEGDAMGLPFADESFEAVTIAFGLRNLPNFMSGIAELRRVLKPSGKLVVLELSNPSTPVIREVHRFYSDHILPHIGAFLSGDRAAYKYLPDSVAKFPDKKRLAAMIAGSGFDKVEFRSLTAGSVAIHTATRA
jgi:demethylmenaquinone methyltransferase/2-methoxy-6-polyprenyl-1,4-benzoquinol methylase